MFSQLLIPSKHDQIPAIVLPVIYLSCSYHQQPSQEQISTIFQPSCSAGTFSNFSKTPTRRLERMPHVTANSFAIYWYRIDDMARVSSISILTTHLKSHFPSPSQTLTNDHVRTSSSNLYHPCTQQMTLPIFVAQYWALHSTNQIKGGRPSGIYSKVPETYKINSCITIIMLGVAPSGGSGQLLKTNQTAPSGTLKTGTTRWEGLIR
jgi:hypothetical protein